MSELNLMPTSLHLCKITIDNSVNDDYQIKWIIGKTRRDLDKLVEKERDEVYNWNYNTPGAVSHRYFNTEYHTSDQIIDFKMDELEGMTVKQFIKILNHEKEIL